MTAFAAALGVLFMDPNLSVAAVYRAGGTGNGVPVRIVRSSPDDIVEFGGGSFVVGTVIIDIRVADAPAPARGDTVTIGAVSYLINGAPRRDPEQLYWRCVAVPT